MPSRPYVLDWNTIPDASGSQPPRTRRSPFVHTSLRQIDFCLSPTDQERSRPEIAAPTAPTKPWFVLRRATPPPAGAVMAIPLMSEEIAAGRKRPAPLLAKRADPEPQEGS